jgi:hypothetical protein
MSCCKFLYLLEELFRSILWSGSELKLDSFCFCSCASRSHFATSTFGDLAVYNVMPFQQNKTWKLYSVERYLGTRGSMA